MTDDCARSIDLNAPATQRDIRALWKAVHQLEDIGPPRGLDSTAPGAPAREGAPDEELRYYKRMFEMVDAALTKAGVPISEGRFDERIAKIAARPAPVPREAPEIVGYLVTDADDMDAFYRRLEHAQKHLLEDGAATLTALTPHPASPSTKGDGK